MRGYPLDEMMGRLTFGEAIYLLLMGEVPSPSIGSLMEAMLVSFIDHGATPPSTLAARNTATTGAPLRACVAAGVLGFGRYHGGDIETCMQFLDAGLELVRKGASYRDAAAAIVEQVPRERARRSPASATASTPATRGPRGCSRWRSSSRSKAEHIQMIRAVEMVIAGRADDRQTPLPVNIDGAIAAVCGDIGIPPEVANALFIISRVPGIAAQAREEIERHTPMRQIDPKDHLYDGPSERRLPERRK